MKTKTKIYRIITLLLLISLTTRAQEQQTIWQWMKQLGGPGWDITNGITCDNDNHIYIGGGFTEKLDCEKKSVESQGNRDIFIARFSEEGKLEWLWRAGGEGMDKITALKIAPENDLYVAGIIDGKSEFGNTEFPGDNKKLFIARINKKGKPDWVQPITFTKSASAYLLETDMQGNAYLGGVFSDTLQCGNIKIQSKGFTDIFIARFGPSGELESIKSFGGKGKEQLSALALDNSGNVYLAGNFEKEMDVDNQTIAPPVQGTTSNIFLFRWNNTFESKRISLWHSPSYCEITGIVSGKNHNVFIAGNFSHQLQCDSVDVKATGPSDFFVCRADTTMKVKWMKTFGTKYVTNIHGLLASKTSGVIVAGTINDTLQLDSLQLIPEGSKGNAFFARFTDDGSITWAESLGSKEGMSISKGMTMDEVGSLYLSGSFSGYLTIPEGELQSAGDEDLFVAKYYNCPSIPDIIDCPEYLCRDSSAELSVPGRFTDVVWNDTLYGPNEIVVNKPGTYRVKMTDKRGCIVRDSVTIKQTPFLTFSLGKDTTLTTRETLLLQGPENLAEYQWQDYSTGQDYLAYSNGQTGTFEYKLRVTDTTGCNWSSRINIEFYKEPGFIDLSAGAGLISVRPNPVKDILYWLLKTTEEAKLAVELTDMQGRLLSHDDIKRYVPGTILKTNMSHLPSGLYYFSIISGENQVTTKIVKE